MSTEITKNGYTLIVDLDDSGQYIEYQCLDIIGNIVRNKGCFTAIRADSSINETIDRIFDDIIHDKMKKSLPALICDLEYLCDKIKDKVDTSSEILAPLLDAMNAIDKLRDIAVENYLNNK